MRTKCFVTAVFVNMYTNPTTTLHELHCLKTCDLTTRKMTLSTKSSLTPPPSQLSPGKYELQCPVTVCIPGQGETTIDTGVSLTLEKGMKLALRPTPVIDIESHDMFDDGVIKVRVRNKTKTPIYVGREEAIAVATLVQITRRRGELGLD